MTATIPHVPVPRTAPQPAPKAPPRGPLQPARACKHGINPGSGCACACHRPAGLHQAMWDLHVDHDPFAADRRAVKP